MLLLAAVPLLPTIRITENTAFILSTTKGNISQLNSQMDREHLPYLTRLAKSIAGLLGIRSEPIVVSNACVSGVMALSVADRLLESGQYDNALVVAADEISSSRVFSPSKLSAPSLAVLMTRSVQGLPLARLLLLLFFP